ncbi:hypothetical protein FOA52_003766, partial [Chlamydomonas sp. UWO 241]
ASTFGELLGARVMFAGAVAVQNPVSFALIPELFPRNKSTALAIYNVAIYVGRSLGFGAALAAEKLANAKGLSGYAMGGLLTPLEGGSSLIYVPIDQVDLSLVSILYTQGDFAAVVPFFRYTNKLGETAGMAIEGGAVDGGGEGAVAGAAGAVAGAVSSLFAEDRAPWREVLTWVAAPGLLVALALVFGLPEPRKAATAAAAAAARRPALPHGLPPPWPPEGYERPAVPDRSPVERLGGLPPPSAQQSTDASAAAAHVPKQPGLFGLLAQHGPALSGLASLLRNRRFMYTSLGASFNDVGSYVLVAFQATFYERVYHLQPSDYAPVLAVVLPFGGIIGGIGGGWFADGASLASGRRAWMTVGATAACAPFMLGSLIAPDSTTSFAALLVGFLLSEAWRAPSANMARSCSPPDAGSSTISLYLCIRNLVGGLGPIGVVLLAQRLDGDLQSAMLLVPVAYALSAGLFWLAEREFGLEQGEAARALLDDLPEGLDDSSVLATGYSSGEADPRSRSRSSPSSGYSSGEDVASRSAGSSGSGGGGVSDVDFGDLRPGDVVEGLAAPPAGVAAGGVADVTLVPPPMEPVKAGAAAAMRAGRG